MRVQFRCGQYKSGHFDNWTKVICNPTGSEARERRERMSERVSEGSSAEQADEWAVRANEQVDERLTHYLHPHFMTFMTARGSNKNPWDPSLRGLTESGNPKKCIDFPYIDIFQAIQDSSPPHGCSYQSGLSKLLHLVWIFKPQ